MKLTKYNIRKFFYFIIILLKNNWRMYSRREFMRELWYTRTSMTWTMSFRLLNKCLIVKKVKNKEWNDRHYIVLDNYKAQQFISQLIVILKEKYWMWESEEKIWKLYFSKK